MNPHSNRTKYSLDIFPTIIADLEANNSLEDTPNSSILYIMGGAAKMLLLLDPLSAYSQQVFS